MTATDFRDTLAAHGLSQSEFARLIGVTDRHIRRYVSGQTKPTGPVVVILRLIECRPDLVHVLREHNS